MPNHSHSVPKASPVRTRRGQPGMTEDDFNAALWGLPSARLARPAMSLRGDDRGSLSDIFWPADGGRITQLRGTPWEGATALYFDFRLRRPLDVCLNPRDELLLTFFLSGQVSGCIGGDPGRALDFTPDRALLRTPNRYGGYQIRIAGECRNVFVQFRLKRHLLPQWLQTLGVQLSARQMERLMYLDDGTVLCNASLTSRIHACLRRIDAEEATGTAFVPLFHARAVELLTYVLLDLGELLKPARSQPPAADPFSACVARARQAIDASPSDAWSVGELASHAHCSPARLQRGFREMTGQSVHEYVRNGRLALAARLLRETRLSVHQVAVEAGWACHGRFSSAFRALHGVTPSDYRLQGSTA